MVIVAPPPKLSGLAIVGYNAAKYLESIGFNVQIEPLIHKLVFGGKARDPTLLISNYLGYDTIHYYRFVLDHFKTRSWIVFVEGYPRITEADKQCAIKHVDHYIAPSQFVREKLEEIGINVSEVIYPGIDPPGEAEVEKYAKVYRERWDSKIVLLYIAANYPRKAIHRLVEASTKLRELTDRDFLVYIFTDNTRNLNVKPGDHLVVDLRFGSISKAELHGMIKACDVYVHPAYCEGLGSQ